MAKTNFVLNNLRRIHQVFNIIFIKIHNAFAFEIYCPGESLLEFHIPNSSLSLCIFLWLCVYFAFAYAAMCFGSILDVVPFVGLVTFSTAPLLQTDSYPVIGIPDHLRLVNPLHS